MAQNYRGILIRIGRFKSLEIYYAKVHLKPLKQLWEDFDSRQQTNAIASEKNESLSLLSWLPSFYDELLLYLEQEWKWYGSYLNIIPSIKTNMNSCNVLRFFREYISPPIHRYSKSITHARAHNIQKLFRLLCRSGH